MKSWRTILALVILLAAGSALLWPRIARTQQSQRVPTIEEYNPKSTLVTKEHKPERAKFPFVDIHSHHWNPTSAEVDELIKGMDSIDLQVMVNLSGGTGDELKRTVEAMKGRYPKRFVVFANPRYDERPSQIRTSVATYCCPFEAASRASGRSKGELKFWSS